MGNGKGDLRRPAQVSQEELNLRWDYAYGKFDLTEGEFKKRIAEIRKRTNKPNTQMRKY